MMRVNKSVVSLLVVVLMVVGGLGLSAGAAHASGTLAGPDAQCRQYITNSFTGVGTPHTATNVTIFWNLTVGVTTEVYWGNFSNPYPFSQSATFITQQGGSSTAPYQVFLDFLEPNTTYYYKIYAPGENLAGVCVGPATYTGSWMTLSEGSYESQSIAAHGGDYVYGTVENANGTPAPSGVVVVATCAHPYIFPNGNPWWSYGTTNSSGQYFVYIPSEWDSWTNSPMDICQSQQSPLNPGAMGYLVCVDNLGTGSTIYCGGSNSNPLPQGNVWPGHWNETVLTWAPQVVNFRLPSNFVTPLFPIVLDFSNGPGSSQFSFEQSTTIQTSLTSGWDLTGGVSVGGGPVGIDGSASGSSTATTTKDAGAGIQSAGTLEWVAKYNSSGTVAFSAIARNWTRTINLMGDPVEQNYNSVYSLAPPSDWLTPENISEVSDWYYLTGFNGIVMQNEPVPPHAVDYGYITTSTSQESSSTYSLGLSVSVGLPGVLSAQLGFGMRWGQTSSTSYSQTLKWEAGSTSSGQFMCYDVYGQAGTFSNPVSSGVMVGIYSWPATYSSGNQTHWCPSP